MAHKLYFNWSTGKDAALALYKLMQDENYDVSSLLTSVNAHYNRVSMHGVRRELVEAQARAIGLPLRTIELPEMPDMETYEKEMERVVKALKQDRFTHAAFGDIFLEDLKAYREKQLKAVGIDCVFPLWKQDTKALLKEYLRLGFRSVIVCIKSDLLDASYAGRVIDENFIDELPENVDCCGENGEFHTFCFDGPIFDKPIPIRIGERTFKEYQNPNQDEVHENKKNMGFWFCDLELDT